MTVGSVLVTEPALIVAVIVLAVPEVVAVKTAVYLPLSVSATVEPKVPLDVPLPSPNATVNPPLVTTLLFASLAINVTSVVSPEEMELRLTETVD